LDSYDVINIQLTIQQQLQFSIIIVCQNVSAIPVSYFLYYCTKFVLHDRLHGESRTRLATNL